MNFCFNMHFLDDSWFWASLMCSFPRRCLYKSCPIFKSSIFPLGFKSSFVCSCYKSVVWFNVENISSLSVACVFTFLSPLKSNNSSFLWSLIFFNSWCFLCPILKNICWTQCHYHFLLYSYKRFTVKLVCWGLWSIWG